MKITLGFRVHDHTIARSDFCVKATKVVGLKSNCKYWRGQILCIRLKIERGIVRTRVVFVPRSVEIKPLLSELNVPGPCCFCKKVTGRPAGCPWWVALTALGGWPKGLKKTSVNLQLVVVLHCARALPIVYVHVTVYRRQDVDLTIS